MKILITGVSSGIGRELTKSLINDGHQVCGISRRKPLLNSLHQELNASRKFISYAGDISEGGFWNRCSKFLSQNKFIPDVVVMNAAILQDDLHPLDINSTRQMINTNFLGVLDGVANLMPFVKPKTQFIAISSIAALRGSSVEGIGYAASKAALNTAFESLSLQYNKTYFFTTISLGPVQTGMTPFQHRQPPFSVTSHQVVKVIKHAMTEKAPYYYYPAIVFVAFRFMNLLPTPIYRACLRLIEKRHRNLV